MGDIKLFQVQASGVSELDGRSAKVEKSLQTLFEHNLEALLGVRFLASEYVTGKEHGGRIDTLGLDENGCPVILEYKRATNENVVSQGLFYLDWLLDHKKEFQWLVMEKLGKESAESVEWSGPRLLCIAGDFTRYDIHAVKHINRNIELIRYRHFGDELLMLDLVNATTAEPIPPAEEEKTQDKKSDPTISDRLAKAPPKLRDLFTSLEAFLTGLGDDVQKKELRFYFAYKRIKNFASVEIFPQANKLSVYVKVNPDAIPLEKGFTRDVRNVGHFGTGDLEITLKSEEDLKRAEPLLIQSYEAS